MSAKKKMCDEKADNTIGQNGMAKTIRYMWTSHWQKKDDKYLAFT